MTPDPAAAVARCARFLEEHAAQTDESLRHQAYVLGRDALDAGAGLIDLAAAIQGAMAAALAAGPSPEARERTLAAMGSLALEILAPFEMAHRGAREANAALRKGNEAREEEIKRIAHAIHDEAGQLLACVHWALDEAVRSVPPESRERFHAVSERLDVVETRLRQISYELRPTILDDLGLEPALRSLADGVSRRSRLRVIVEGTGGGRLAPRLETVIYRAAQEALQNAVKHANATRVLIHLRRSRGTIACSIRDDGVGFPSAASAAPGAATGLGLIGIRERVANVGGDVEIRSESGRGTEVSVRIPLGVTDGHARSARR
ncbi:MAG TPA: sensor histidine kinase [Candidatus Eisenbacteria bacterium]|nr:sensor histidine kinase [Candidatus Eisenbacteria bacterium]